MSKLQINSSNSISRIISGSIQSGGALLFLDEGMTLGASELLRQLEQELGGKIAFATRSMSTLLNKCATQSQDVLFLGAISERQARAIAEVCLCKVIKEKSYADWSESLFDVEWDVSEFSVAKIISLIEEASNFAVQVKKQTSVALFLDRDDVIVSNVPYNKNPDKVVLIPGIVELINKAHQNQQLVIICSNQSGIGRGMVTVEQYRCVHQRMLSLLAAQGAWIDDCYWASYIDGSILQDSDLEPQMRKPRPGMFLIAARKWSIDMKKSRMIGDSATDLVAAFRSGVQNLYLFASEKVEQEKAALENFQKQDPEFRYQIIQDLRTHL